MTTMTKQKMLNVNCGAGLWAGRAYPMGRDTITVLCLGMVVERRAQVRAGILNFSAPVISNQRCRTSSNGFPKITAGNYRLISMQQR
jgi:hypothetical protein